MTGTLIIRLLGRRRIENVDRTANHLVQQFVGQFKLLFRFLQPLFAHPEHSFATSLIYTCHKTYWYMPRHFFSSSQISYTLSLARHAAPRSITSMQFNAQFHKSASFRVFRFMSTRVPCSREAVTASDCSLAEASYSAKVIQTATTAWSQASQAYSASSSVDSSSAQTLYSRRTM